MNHRRLTVYQLAKTHGLSWSRTKRTLERHGVMPGPDGMYSEAEFLNARKMGAQMDKRRVAVSTEDVRKLKATKMQKQVEILDLEIKRAEIELEQRQSKVISVEAHNEKMRAAVALAQAWWDKALEAAEARLKNETVLQMMREAREHAFREIAEMIGETGGGTPEKP